MKNSNCNFIILVRRKIIFSKKDKSVDLNDPITGKPFFKPKICRPPKKVPENLKLLLKVF